MPKEFVEEKEFVRDKEIVEHVVIDVKGQTNIKRDEDFLTQS